MQGPKIWSGDLCATWSATAAKEARRKGSERTNEERNLYSLSSWNGVRKEVKEGEEGKAAGNGGGEEDSRKIRQFPTVTLRRRYGKMRERGDHYPEITSYLSESVVVGSHSAIAIRDGYAGRK